MRYLVLCTWLRTPEEERAVQRDGEEAKTIMQRTLEQLSCCLDCRYAKDWYVIREVCPLAFSPVYKFRANSCDVYKEYINPEIYIFPGVIIKSAVCIEFDENQTWSNVVVSCYS